jgi:glycosyltransferase involved in cell wall biosynthesis
MVVHAGYPLGETRVQREALSLIDAGYHVDVVCMRLGDEPRSENVSGVDVHRLPLRRRRGQGFVGQLVEYLAFFFLAFFKVTKLHLRYRYGTIQVHNPPDFLVFSALVPKLMGARIIIDLHDLTPEFFAARAGAAMDSWPTRLVLWQEALACRFADHVITVTDHWLHKLRDRGVDATKLSVVMNLADPRFFPGDASPPDAQPDPGGLRIVYHGTFTYRYGLDIVIRAVAKVRSEVPGVSLSLIGGGDARPSLIALAQQLGVEDVVEFSSRSLHVSELAAQILQADVAVIANRTDVLTDDLLPAKMMEYVALGMPIITARTTTIASYFDEDTVQFFTPGDEEELAAAIMGLDRDRDRLTTLAANTRRLALKYRWPDAATRYVATVTDLQER